MTNILEKKFFTNTVLETRCCKIYQQVSYLNTRKILLACKITPDAFADNV